MPVHGDQVVDRVQRVEKEVRMELHLQHLQLGACETRFEPAFIQRTCAGLARVLPQVKAEHDAEESPRIVDEEAAQRRKEFKCKCYRDVFGNRFGHYEWKHKRPHGSVDKDECREQQEVQDTSPFKIRQRDGNSIENPYEREGYDTFQKIVAEREMKHERQRKPLAIVIGIDEHLERSEHAKEGPRQQSKSAERCDARP